MSRFFIDRPVFAWVIAIVIMLAGALAIATLPVAQYPAIAPPTISITARYPGASAKTLEEGVTQVIEQRMNGLDGFVYMSSSSDASGTATITLTFDPSVDPDIKRAAKEPAFPRTRVRQDRRPPVCRAHQRDAGLDRRAERHPDQGGERRHRVREGRRPGT